jgi:hypothetical protein
MTKMKNILREKGSMDGCSILMTTKQKEVMRKRSEHMGDLNAQSRKKLLDPLI